MRYIVVLLALEDVDPEDDGGQIPVTEGLCLCDDYPGVSRAIEAALLMSYDWAVYEVTGEFQRPSAVRCAVTFQKDGKTIDHIG